MILIPKGFRPMLACQKPIDVNIFNRFPMYASYKLDGVRCLANYQDAISRTLKGIPNREIRQRLPQLLSHPEISQTLIFDGELLTQCLLDHDETFNQIQSKVMSHDTTGFCWTYNIFDVWDRQWTISPPYEMRYRMLMQLVQMNILDTRFIKVLHQTLIINRDELQECCDLVDENKMEGLILRSPSSPYKFGRATPNEGYLYKVKPYKYGEAIIIGMKELMHNDNVATIGELGQTKRSSHACNQTASGMMGCLIVQDCKTGIVFEIGTGFTKGERRAAWTTQNAESYTWIGAKAKYKFQEFGIKEKPRTPVYIGMKQ